MANKRQETELQGEARQLKADLHRYQRMLQAIEKKDAVMAEYDEVRNAMTLRLH